MKWPEHMDTGDIDVSGLHIARETDYIRGVLVAYATPALLTDRPFGELEWQRRRGLLGL